MRFKRHDATHAQLRTQTERHVASRPLFAHCRTHHMRQPLATKGLRGCQSGPATGHELGIGFLEALGRNDAFRRDAAAFQVTAAVDGLEHIGGQAPCFLEDRDHFFATDAQFGVARQSQNTVQLAVGGQSAEQIGDRSDVRHGK